MEGERNMIKDHSKKIDKQNIEDILALSSIQKGLLFHYLKNKGRGYYCQQLSLSLSGDICMTTLRRAWGFVVETNEMLRTVFRWERLSKPAQIILREFKVPINEHDFSDLSKEDCDKELERIKERDRKQELDIETQPLKVDVYKLRENKWEMVVTWHHIIFDGWSNGIILKEFINAYNAFHCNDQLVKPAKNRYKEFIKWEQIQDKKLNNSFWKGYLKEFHGTTALPYDNNNLNEAVMKSFTSRLTTLQTKDLYGFIRSHEITLASVFYTIWGILLQKYNSSRDVVFGTTVAGRTTDIKGVEEIVGLFINTIPLRILSKDNYKLIDLIKSVNSDLKKRKEHENTPLVDIKACSEIQGSDSVFNSIVVLENYPLDDSIRNKGAIKIEGYNMYETTNYDITLGITSFDVLELDFSYNSQKFMDDTIERMAGHFKEILLQILGDHNEILSNIDITSKEERKQILHGFNSPIENNFENQVIHGLFEKQTLKNPNAVAVIYNDKEYTYGEINAKANMLARLLRQNGIKAEDTVGIIVKRSVYSIIAMMAVLKSGGAYIPIDHGCSLERISYMLEDSGAGVVLTQRELLPGFDYKGKTIYMDDGNIYTGASTNLENINSNKDLAYIIYTSGSTGKPKGVMAEHRNPIAYVNAFQREFSLTSNDVVLQQAPCSFDHSVEEIYPALLNGGSIVIVDKLDVLDINKLIEIINRNHISVVTCQPLLLNELNKAPRLESVHTFLSGADVLKPQYISKLSSYARVYNTYGPTEATVCASYYRCCMNDNDINIPIGKPIHNYRIYILNKDDMIMPIGIPGEICISGAGIARGYINNRKLSEDRFVKEPFDSNNVMYRTGDIGKWLDDGNIEFLGRYDEQVKIRGFRVEPGEIEYHLKTHDSVEDAVVIPIDSPRGIKSLGAYIIPRHEVKPQELRDYLGNKLPSYMIPAYFYRIDSIPMTSNSKVDIRALSNCNNPFDNEVKTKENLSSTEEKLLRIWEEVLHTKGIGLNENFFDVGGNSILLMQMYGMMEKQYSFGLTITDLFTYTTISKQGKYIDNRGVDSEIDNALYQEAEKVKLDEVSKNDIAIIGISLKLPRANTMEEFLNNLRSGTDCVGEMPLSRKNDVDRYFKFLGKDLKKIKYGEAAYIEDIDKFDYNFYKISPKEASLLDPNQRLFLETAWNTIEDAGYGGQRLVGSKTGVYLGFGSEPDYKRMISEIEPDCAAMAMPGNTRPIIASRLSYILDLRGPSMVVDTTCSSSLVAIHLACQAIRNGECDLALAGGIQLHLIPVRNYEVGIESSTARAKTFDDSSDGTGAGEGVVVILLKPLTRALKDRDNIYGVIKSSAINQDGSSIGLTAPNARAQEEVIVDAWNRAGINPETISYIEAHGTGTKLGDPIEIEGITRAFRRYTDKKQFCAVGSVKSNIGHLDNTAGAVGLVKAILSLKYKELFPTLHFKRPNRKIPFVDSPVYVNDKLRKWNSNRDKRRCGVSAFGLSGTNCHIVLEEPPIIRNVKKEDFKSFEILTISAKSKMALQSLIGRYCDYLSTYDDINFKDLCYTANTGRGHYSYRVALLAKGKEELLSLLRDIRLNGFKGIELQDLCYTSFNVTNRQNEDKLMEKNNKDMCKLVDIKIKEYIDSQRDRKAVLHDICDLYIKGADIGWERLYGHERRQRISIPTYPFVKNRCWLDIPGIEEDEIHKNSSYYYEMEWICEPISDSISIEEKGFVLIFKDSTGKGNKIAEKLKYKGIDTIEISMDREYKKINDNSYSIDDSYESYIKLIKELKNRDIRKIIHMASIKTTQEIESWEDFQHTQRIGVYSLFYLVKAIGNVNLKEKIDITIISDYVNRVTGKEERFNPENGTLMGLGKVIGFENKNLSCKQVDIDACTDLEQIIKEIWLGDRPYQIAYRNNTRYVEQLIDVDIDKVDIKGLGIKDGGVYIITGGAGGIGAEISKYIASIHKVNLVLINRTKLPDSREWQLKLKGEKNSITRKIKNIVEIEAMGAKVSYYNADISNPNELKRVLEDVRGTYGGIDGIIHCAGVPGDGFIINKDEEVFKDVLLPKVQGTWLLDDMTKNDELDFFILFSSITSISGAPGQGDYTAANSYLDAFSYYRNGLGKPTLTINWTGWKETGMAVGYIGEIDNSIFRAFTTKQAIDSFKKVVGGNIKDKDRIMIGDFNYYGCDFDKTIFDIGIKVNEGLKEKYEKIESNVVKDIEKPKKKDVLLRGRKNKDYSQLERCLGNIWGEILGHKEINIDDDFFELGGNSISAIRIEVELEKLNIEFSSRDLYKYPSINKLAKHLSGGNEEGIQTNIKPFEMQKTIVHDIGYNKSHERDSKILDKFEPFNDIFYRNCFYNSLFPIVHHFNGDIMPFILRDIIVFQKSEDDNNNSYGIEYLAKDDLKHVCKQEDIEVDERYNSKEIILEIIEAISDDRPVVLWVDGYYESIRRDVYLKQHIKHSLLIYGYNQKEKLFNVIEHDRFENLSYKKCVIPYLDVEKAYYGYIENFLKGKEAATHYVFNFNEGNKRNEKAQMPIKKYIREFAENMLNHKEAVEASMMVLDDFIETYKKLSSSNIELRENIDYLIEFLNAVINAKNFEKYRLLRIFEDKSEIIELLDRIIEKWELIRKPLIRFMYMPVYKPEVFELSYQNLIEAARDERVFNEVLFLKLIEIIN